MTNDMNRTNQLQQGEPRGIWARIGGGRYNILTTVSIRLLITQASKAVMILKRSVTGPLVDKFLTYAVLKIMYSMVLAR